MPYADADRLVWLTNENSDLGVNGAFLNPADILDFREQSRYFDRIAAWGALPVNLYGARTLERVESVYVTPNFFRTLGVQPKLGRDFAETDEPENSVIISHALWLRQFGGEQSAIGRKISFGLHPSSPDASCVIVGVLPEDSNFPARIDVFTVSEIDRTDLTRGGSHNLRTIGRLTPGVTIEQAQAEMNTLTARQAELYPDTNKGWQVHIDSFREHLFGNSTPALWSLFAAVGMVLLIACANVANLQLTARLYQAARTGRTTRAWRWKVAHTSILRDRKPAALRSWLCCRISCRCLVSFVRASAWAGIDTAAEGRVAERSGSLVRNGNLDS